MAKSGKFWRRHHSLALAVGRGEVDKFERHYASEGVHVEHRRTACGDCEPIITSRAQFEAMLRARGMVDKG